MFADDTNITSSGNCIDNVENAVNSDLENLVLMANCFYFYYISIIYPQTKPKRSKNSFPNNWY